MKLKDELKNLPKDIVYDIYISLVYEAKDYDNITRSKMLDAIIKEYAQYNYLYYICTEKELKFLKHIQSESITSEDKEKYNWEINELDRKCIFSKTTYEVYEEQIDNVKSALSYYKKHIKQKKNNDKMATFIVGVVKIQAEMLTAALSDIVESVFGIAHSNVDKILGHPLIHFYCSFYDHYFEFSKKEEEIIYYRDYYDTLDSLYDQRKEYAISGSKEFDIRDNYDMFYYGFPIRNKYVEKMYSTVNASPLKEYIFNVIEEARILNDREFLNSLITDPELLKIINKALDETPSSALNGLTPNEYKKQIKLKSQLDAKFNRILQENAHLCKTSADEFYKLYFALLEYTNKKYHINPNIKKIYKQDQIDVNKLQPIDVHLWNNKNIIDDFINENPYHFTKEEIDIVKEFKKSIHSDELIIVGFEKEYTEILSQDGKIYMVKGIRANLDELIDINKIPIIVETTLLMFKDNIIYNSFLSIMDLELGIHMKEVLLEEYKNSIKYYHL